MARFQTVKIMDQNIQTFLVDVTWLLSQDSLVDLKYIFVGALGG